MLSDYENIFCKYCVSTTLQSTPYQTSEMFEWYASETKWYVQVSRETEDDSFMTNHLVFHTWYLCWHHEPLLIQQTRLHGKQKTNKYKLSMYSTWAKQTWKN